MTRVVVTTLVTLTATPLMFMLFMPFVRYTQQQQQSLDGIINPDSSVRLLCFSKARRAKNRGTFWTNSSVSSASAKKSSVRSAAFPVLRCTTDAQSTPGDTQTLLRRVHLLRRQSPQRIHPVVYRPILHRSVHQAPRPILHRPRRRNNRRGFPRLRHRPLRWIPSPTHRQALRLLMGKEEVTTR